MVDAFQLAHQVFADYAGLGLQLVEFFFSVDPMVTPEFARDDSQ
jgi:hypothetical protein